MILAGTPLALIYAVRCCRRSPRSRWSVTALVIAAIEMLAVACLVVRAMMR